MKNKKGFTLIELLAVIVILAIIALIAIPIVLNMVNNARKSAAISSAYGYIEAIDTYQGLQEVNGFDVLKEGKYNVAIETEIDGTTYNSINSYIKMKGKKATGGTVNITSSGNVGTALICMNDYAISYQNNKAEIEGNDCDDMELYVDFAINSTEWEAEKTLTITYPNKDYDYYYKIESGNVELNGVELTNNTEIKATEKIVTLTLKENSKVTAWIVKNGKKINERTYEETKIDTVEIGLPTATISDSLPILTTTGVVAPTKAKLLTISYTEQEGTSVYYSLDNGTTWAKYTSPVGIDDNVSAKAKLVREESKREGETVTATTSSLTAVASNTYDDDVSSSSQTSGYLQISNEMRNKKLLLYYGTYQSYSDNYGYIKFLDDNLSEINNASYTVTKEGVTMSWVTHNKSFSIPSNASYVNLIFNEYGITLNEIYADTSE